MGSRKDRKLQKTRQSLMIVRDTEHWHYLDPLDQYLSRVCWVVRGRGSGQAKGVKLLEWLWAQPVLFASRGTGAAV